MNKDNEKDDDTDSDMFCLGSRQMCRDCHPHKAAFAASQMMMIVEIIVQVHSTVFGIFSTRHILSKKKNKQTMGWKQNKHCLWHYVKVDVASMQTFSGPTFCKYRPCQTLQKYFLEIFKCICKIYSESRGLQDSFSSL